MAFILMGASKAQEFLSKVLDKMRKSLLHALTMFIFSPYNEEGRGDLFVKTLNSFATLSMHYLNSGKIFPTLVLQDYIENKWLEGCTALCKSCGQCSGK